MSEKEFLKAMGSNIKNIRKERKLTVRKLGELIDIDYAHISRMENGQFKSRVSTLKKMADVFDVHITDFFLPLPNGK